MVVAALLALTCANAANAAKGHSHIVSLKIGDRFDIAGTHIKCKVVGSGAGKRSPDVTCSVAASGTTTPLASSYTFSFGDRGVSVVGPGSRQAVVFGARTDSHLPLGDPAPADRSTRPQNAHLHPVSQGLEGVDVAGTSIVCVAVSYPKPSGPQLTCTLSSPAITKALRKPLLAFRPLTVTLSSQWLRVWRMSTTKTQRIVFSRRQPSS